MSDEAWVVQVDGASMMSEHQTLMGVAQAPTFALLAGRHSSPLEQDSS